MEQVNINVHDNRTVMEVGMKALTRTLGAVGTVYFIRQLTNGRWNWTQDRQNRLDGITMADIENDIKDIRSTGNSIFPHSNIEGM
jgi:hypothetical protein